MARLLFDAPWWLPTTLAFLGIALFWNGNRRRETKVRNAGLLFVLAAGLVLLVSHFVDTDVEKVTKQSKQLVYSVEKRDWATLKTILDPLTSLHVLGGAAEVYGTRDEIIAGAKKAVDQYGLKNVRILSTTPEQTDTVINVTMTIMSEQEFTGGRPITTTWQFEWQQSGETWSLSRITNIKIGNMQGENAGRQFPRP
ncbi:MAG: hypothetical protein QOF78_2879 [Phycisphaerales bacterium]|nr:hypothetical protein [Phycisphaerales bacterium]